jgi:hypothetical protein
VSAGIFDFGLRKRCSREGREAPTGAPTESGQVRGADAERKGIQGGSVSGTEAFGGDLLRNLSRVPIGVLLLKGGGADGRGGVK